MQGIQFLINENGQKTAVVIDLQEYGELWEDFYDILVARSRQDEPRETLEEIRQQLRNQGKLSE
jgi:PHD/YefM family antitoxin component YafN of YafNO toxin-antitoxin module